MTTNRFIKINPINHDDVTGPKISGSAAHFVEEVVIAIDDISSAALELQLYSDGHSDGNFVKGQVVIKMKGGATHLHSLRTIAGEPALVKSEFQDFKQALGFTLDN